MGKGDAVLAKAIERATAAGADVSALSSDKYSYLPSGQRAGYKEALRAKAEKRARLPLGGAAAAAPRARSKTF